MKKLIGLYIFIIFSIICFAVYSYNPPIQLLKGILFPLELHRILAGISSIVLFLICFKAHSIYLKTLEKRMLIMSGSFLTAGFLNIYHLIIATKFPYDIINLENLTHNPHLFFLQAEHEIIAAALFLSVFYSSKFQASNHLKLKNYLLSAGVLFSVAIICMLINPVLYGAYSQKLFIFKQSTSIIDASLVFLTAFIFADMRISNQKSMFSAFTLGLIILGLGQMFYTDPHNWQINGVAAHLFRAIGYTLLLAGIQDIQELKTISYRQKLQAYLNIFIILTYLMLVSLSAVIFNIIFPSYAPLLFLTVLLAAAIIKDLTAICFTEPLVIMTDIIKRYTPEHEPETIPISSQDEIGTLTNIINTITAQNWKNKKEIEKLNDLLEIKVLERTKQLESVNKELESFSYTVSHDLRAPLRGMDGYSLALLEDYEDKLDEKGKEYLNYIRENSKSMGILINTLLNFSRLNRSEMFIKPLNLSEIATDILNTLKRPDNTRNIESKIAENIQCEGDEVLIKLVMQNLIENALKFTQNTSNTVIEFGMNISEDNEKVFFVKDNGAGFDMRYIDKLFNPFQRLHQTHEYPGTGVGLATVQRIINRHGGKIWAEGEIGKGATVHFVI